MQTFFIFILSFFSLSFYAQNHPDDVIGKWMDLEKRVLVEVFKSGKDYRAKVLWFNEIEGCKKPIHEHEDSSNPNPKLRNRKIIGMEILSGLVYNPEDKEWQNGKIYDASSGRTWSSVAWLEIGLLKVRGYWKMRLLGKSMSFRRVR